MKKYLITAVSCQEENAVFVNANSIDDAIAMLRRGEVDLSGVMDVDCQFKDFDITSKTIKMLNSVNMINIFVEMINKLRRKSQTEV